MWAWRLIRSGPMPAGQNMALDLALLEEHAPGDPPILRDYTWQPAGVTLGCNQGASSVDLAACRRLGIGVARRPTGGGAILHEEGEVTFSVVAARSGLGVASLMDSYRVLGQAIAAGLGALGIAAKLVDREGEPQAGPGENPVCFARRARCDLCCQGRKLVGSAQLQRAGKLLQQNSLPLVFDRERQAAVFGPAAREAEQVMVLPEAAGRPVSFDEACQALAWGWAEALGAGLEPSVPTPTELARAERLLPELEIYHPIPSGSTLP